LNNLDWFDISQYEKFNELTIRELFNELTFRVRLYNNIYSDDEYEGFYPTDEWLSILTKKPIVTNQLSLDTINNYIPSSKLDCSCGSPNSGVKLASPADISLQEHYLQTQHYILNLSTPEKMNIWADIIHSNSCDYCFHKVSNIFRDQEEHPKPASFTNFCTQCQEGIIPQELHDELLIAVPKERIQRNCDICNYEHVNTSFDQDLDFNLLAIDFKNKTNEELIDAFNFQINKFRTKLNIPEPQIDNKSRPKVANKYFKDIINNKVIPFLDLMLWELWCAGFSESRRHLLSVVELPLKTNQYLQGNVLLDSLFPPSNQTDYEAKDTDWISKHKRSIQKVYLNPNILDNNQAFLRSDVEYASRKSTF